MLARLPFSAGYSRRAGCWWAAMFRNVIGAFAGLAMMCVAGATAPVTAELLDRGGGLIYDDVLNITWLQDANYAATDITVDRVSEIIAEIGTVGGHTLVSSDFRFGPSEDRLNWWGAVAWAQSLEFGGFHDWRLPSMDVDGDMLVVDGSSASEAVVRDNEYAYMFYQNLGGTGKSVETGGTGGTPITGDVTIGSVSLRNIQTLAYWSATDFSVSPGSSAWAFDFFRVEQVGANKDGNFAYAWAVMDGDVIPPSNTDTCDVGGGPNDIDTVTASYDDVADEIVVEMVLCADADNKTTYRVYFDHEGGIDDGPDTLEPNPDCVRTWDDRMLHKGRRDRGPGMIDIVGNILTFRVAVADLNPFLALGDTVLISTDTRLKKDTDNAPNTESGDGCPRPEVASEVISLELN